MGAGKAAGAAVVNGGGSVASAGEAARGNIFLRLRDYEFLSSAVCTSCG